MASRDREDKVPRLRISFAQLERKCSELLLEGFESKPAELDLDDVASSSSCTESDARKDLSAYGVGQGRRDSPKKGASGAGVFQIKPTTPQIASDDPRTEARRRRAVEQLERWQRGIWLPREDEAGRFSEPGSGRDPTRARGRTDRYQEVSGRQRADTEGTEHAQKGTESDRLGQGLLSGGKFEKERTRQRRHTDDGGGASDRRRMNERRLGDTAKFENKRESLSTGHRLSSTAADGEMTVLLADWRRYTDGRIQGALSKLTDQHYKLTQILHTW